MRENFKIEKELLFKNNIKEITSISLDSDYKLDNGVLVGNFLISGDYRIHEVSINKEKFNFKLPFKHNITDDIDKTTLKVEITDFVYDYKKDELMVNIEYEVIGDRKDILIFENEETLDDFLNKREVEVIDTRLEEIKEEIETHDNTSEESQTEDVIIIPYKSNEKNDEDIEEEKIVRNEEKRYKNIDDEKKEDYIDEEDKDLRKYGIDKDNNENNQYKEEINLNLIKEENGIQTEEIINSVSNIQDKFITYKIYKVEENDTLEGIILKYHTSIDELKEYNELGNINVGDKIIIPTYE